MHTPRLRVLSVLSTVLALATFAPGASAQVSAIHILNTPQDAPSLGQGETRMLWGSMSTGGNPALLGHQTQLEFHAMPTTNWPTDLQRVTAIRATIPISTFSRGLAFHLSYRRYTVGPQLVRTAFEPEGNGQTFTARMWSASVGVGAELFPWLSAGVTGTLTDPTEALTRVVSLDAGLIAQTPPRVMRGHTVRARVGAAILNSGQEPERTGSSLAKAEIFARVGIPPFQPPREAVMAAGVSWEQPTHYRVEMAGELGKPWYENAPAPWNQRYGAQLILLDLVALRGGYTRNEAYADATFGAGVRIPSPWGWSLDLDYASRPDPFSGNSLYDDHRRRDFYSAQIRGSWGPFGR